MKDAFVQYGKSFYYEESDFHSIVNYPYRFKCGMDILCIKGKGTLSTGIQTYQLQECSELIFLSGTLLQLIDATEDFKVRIFIFSKELFDEVAIQIDTSYFHFIGETPLYNHPLGGESWQNANMWMDMSQMLCKEEKNTFSNYLEHNFLQSFMMWTCNTIPTKFIFTGNSYSRRQMLYHRFLSMVHDHSIMQHDVQFYANSLCISTRYLNEITNCFGKSPKQLIDEQLIAEIKVLLRYTDLSITQIAEQLKFPDQSYLSRYFKKHTGDSPSNYRIS
jgi:AraC family transcriptional activator of pobA